MFVAIALSAALLGVTPPGYHMSTVEARSAKIAYIRLIGPAHHLLDVGDCSPQPGPGPDCQRVTAMSTACVAADGVHGRHRLRFLCDVDVRLNWTSVPLCRTVLTRVIQRLSLPPYARKTPYSDDGFVANGWWNKPRDRILRITPRKPFYFHQCTPYIGPG